MDDKLVHVKPAPLALPDLTSGGIGMDSELFSRIKPSYLEIIQKSTKDDSALPFIGKFRDRASKQIFEEMRWVLLDKPQPQREWMKEKNVFTKENKWCFSTDAITPHDKAQHPPALQCDTCPMGDIRWEKYRETGNPDDLPLCKFFYRLFLADRATQLPYIFNVKGTAVSPFKESMTNLAKTIKMQALNVAAQNKVLAQQGKALLPYPNIFDFTFTVYPYQKVKGGPFLLGIKDIKQLNEEGKKEFGQLYLQYTQARLASQVVEEETEDVEVEASSTTSPTSQAQEVSAVVGTQEYVPTRDGKKVEI